MSILVVRISELAKALEKLREDHGDLEVWLSVCYSKVFDAGSGPEDYGVHNAFASGPLVSVGPENNIRAVCRDPRNKAVLTVELSAIDL